MLQALRTTLITALTGFSLNAAALEYPIGTPNTKENPAGNIFGRHTDRATGVRPWFKPIEAEYEFTYAGLGKKGGY